MPQTFRCLDRVNGRHLLVVADHDNSGSRRQLAEAHHCVCHIQLRRFIDQHDVEEWGASGYWVRQLEELVYGAGDDRQTVRLLEPALQLYPFERIVHRRQVMGEERIDPGGCAGAEARQKYLICDAFRLQKFGKAPGYVVDSDPGETSDGDPQWPFFGNCLNRERGKIGLRRAALACAGRSPPKGERRLTARAIASRWR